uniref:Major basic nuclear protein-like n=1 Tax=Karlodinium veneficum TaxID=407301 RepID=E8Z727_KARVE|nr:major basic nuclear protein-like [Karlodinium veneficum]
MPAFFTSVVAIDARLFSMSEHAFCFNPCSMARALAKAPFVIAFFSPAFIDFIGGNMVKKAGIFSIPGLCRIKTRTKPATKAGVRNVFGKDVKVKAKPARTIVKGYCAAALKKQI